MIDSVDIARAQIIWNYETCKLHKRVKHFPIDPPYSLKQTSN